MTDDLDEIIALFDTLGNCQSIELFVGQLLQTVLIVNFNIKHVRPTFKLFIIDDAAKIDSVLIGVINFFEYALVHSFTSKSKLTYVFGEQGINLVVG